MSAERLDAPAVASATAEGGTVGRVVELGHARSAAKVRWGQFQMVSKRQFCDIVGVSPRTLEKWMYRMDPPLPFEKYGPKHNSRVKIPLLRGQNWVRENVANGP